MDDKAEFSACWVARCCYELKQHSASFSTVATQCTELTIDTTHTHTHAQSSTQTRTEQKSIIRNVCSARHGNEISITTRCRASRTTLTAVTDVSVAVAVSISVAVSVAVTVAVFVAVSVSVAVAALIKAATALCRCLAIKCKTSQPQATGSRTCLAATQPGSLSTS